MFVGHFGVALAAKKLAPNASLGTAIFSAEFLDLLWPAFLLLGIEHVRIAPGIMRMSPLDFTDYPFSHSLLMVLLWSALVGGIYYVLRRNGRGALVMAGVVFSHWPLDFLVHRPDLLLYPGGGSRYGLGLWNYPLIAVPLELIIFVAGVWIYLNSTQPRDKVGRYGFWSLAVFVLLAWISTLFAGAPPSVPALAWGGMSIWLLVLWGWWADRHRVSTAHQASS